MNYVRVGRVREAENSEGFDESAARPGAEWEDLKGHVWQVGGIDQALELLAQ